MEDIKRIKKVLEEKLGEDLYANIDEIDEEEDLVNIGVDSLNVIKLIVGIEEEFNIHFQDTDIQGKSWKNLKTISNLIKERK